MELSKERLERLRELLAPAHQQIVIVSHTNPDGDAVGSSLAWAEALRSMGHEVTCVVPNKYPYFLDWMQGIEEVVVFKNDTEGRAARAIADADILFCLDFNAVSRLEILSETIGANTTARRVLIDHHLSPDEGFDLSFSHPDSSSTCFLVYSIVEALFGAQAVTRRMAEALYVGIMTDTGNFAYSFLTPELFRAVAVLVGTGISIPDIHNNVYNAYTEGRARLFGYAINRKMEIIQDGTVAYMSLLENEMRRFQFQQGDSEGFVNYALTVKKMKMSAMFLAHRKFIRVSLRSRGDVDVNLFARKYFSGGGHKNAAGGKSFVSMQETIAHYIKSVKEFADEGPSRLIRRSGRAAAVSGSSLRPDFRLSMVPADRFRLSIVLRRLCPSGFRWSAALWRFPAVNRFGCGFRLLDSAARFPAVNCLAAVSAPDFWLPIAFAATLPVRFPVVCRLVAVSGGQSFCCGFRLLDSAARFSGCQLSCGGFCTGFLAADRLCSDFCPSDSGCMASGACRIASAGQQRPLRFRCARGSRLRFPVFGPSCTRIPAVIFAGCRKRCCLINLERYGRFPTQSLHYGGPDAQLHPDGRTAFHLAARRQQTHRRVGIPI